MQLNSKRQPVHGTANDNRIQEYPGSFVMVDKRDINVDESYQRAMTYDKIRLIKESFKWSAFGVITLVRRADGTFYAIDGQHRVFVAKAIDEISTIPCLVFDIDSVSEEAKGFLAINTGRKPLTSIDTFNAKVTSGDPIAIEIKRLAKDNGYVIAKSSSVDTIRCVGSVARYLRDKKMHVTAVFPIVADLCRGGIFNRDLFEAMVYLHQHTEGDITKRDSVARLERIGLKDLKESMAKAAGYYGRGTGKVWAFGIATALNAGRQAQNRITIEITV